MIEVVKHSDKQLNIILAQIYRWAILVVKRVFVADIYRIWRKIGRTFFPKFWLKKSPCVLHDVGKVRDLPQA